MIMEKVPVNIIEPNKSILMSYQQIISQTKLFPISTVFFAHDYSVSDRGNEALMMFKKRYEK